MALVTSISSMFTKPLSANERREKILVVLDKTLQQFSEKLDQGKIRINSTADLERIVRSVSAIVEETSVPEETAKTAEVSIPDDPELTTLYQKLYQKYNQANDAD